MKTERMPWTCRWSAYQPTTPSPVWMTEWLAQWTCLAQPNQPPVPDLERCAACPKWEPRHGWTEADRAGR